MARFSGKPAHKGPISPCHSDRGVARSNFVWACLCVHICGNIAGIATFVPGLSLANSPNSRLQHASIGVGGMGWSDLNSILNGGTTDIVAICDADANKESFPAWQIARFTFPGTKYTAQKTINGTWCNGPKRPSRDLVPMPPEYNLPGAGLIIVGDQGVMALPHWAGPQLYPLEKFKAYKRPKVKSIDHYQQWVDACLGKGKAEANFDYSGPLTETVQLGNLAINFPNQTLNWDAQDFKIKNIPQANKHLHKKYREAWKIKGLT